jgi:hypothetical protein
MQTTQHNYTRCPVYPHPSACSSRAAVEAIQHRTGLLVITTAIGRPKTVTPPNNSPVDNSTWPFGGDAA